MATRDLSPRGSSLDDFNTEMDDGYFYDDYDTSPLLTNDELEGAEFRTHRSFDGRLYSLLSPMRRKPVTQSRAIMPSRNIRVCLCRGFLICVLCGIGFIAGYFTSKSTAPFCVSRLLAKEGVQSFHGLALEEVSASNIEKSFR